MCKSISRFAVFCISAILIACSPQTVIPTSTATATKTPSPTATFTPTSTFTPTATLRVPVLENTPVPQYDNAISAENIDRLFPVGIYGTGEVEIIISPESKYILVSTASGIYLFDANTGDLLWEKLVMVAKPSFSADGAMLALVTVHGPEIWQSENGEMLSKPDAPEGLYCLYRYGCYGEKLLNVRRISFTPDGKSLLYLVEKQGKNEWGFVSSNETKIFIWDIGNSAVVNSIEETNWEKALITFEISPNGQYLIYARDPGRLEVWSFTTWEKMYQIQIPTGRFGLVNPEIIVSEDSQIAIGFSLFASRMVVWNLESGKILSQPSISRQPWSIGFLDQRRWLYVDNNGNHLLNLENGQIMQLPGELTETVPGDSWGSVKIYEDIIGFTGDGKVIVDARQRTGALEIWKYGNDWTIETSLPLEYSERLRECIVGVGEAMLTCRASAGLVHIKQNGAFEIEEDVRAGIAEQFQETSSKLPALFSPDGKMIYAANGIRRLSDGALLYPVKECCAGFLYDNTPVWLDQSREKLELVDLTTQQTRLILDADPKADSYYFSPNGSYLIKEKDAIFWLFDLREAKEVVSFGNPNGSESMASFSLDGALFAYTYRGIHVGTRIYGDRATVSVFDTAEGKHLVENLAKGANAISVSHDGQLLGADVGYDDPDVGYDKKRKVEIYTINDGEKIKSLPINCDALAFSKDNQALFCGSNDGLLQVWDIESGELLFETLAHKDTIESILLSPDGTLLATTSRDGASKLWSIWPAP